MRIPQFQAILPAGAAGILLFLSSPGSPGSGLFAWVALWPLFAGIRKAPLKSAFYQGLLCGMIYYSLLLYWVVIVLTTFGKLALSISIPALLLLALYMSLYPAIFCMAMTITREKIPLAAAAPVIWVGLDFLRSHLFSGFPWQDLAYSQYTFPWLLQISNIFGHYGLTFVIILTNCLFFLVFHRTVISRQKKPAPQPPLKQMAWAAVIILLVLAYNFRQYHNTAELLPKLPHYGITVVQGNIAQDQKWLPQKVAETVSTYIQLSSQALAEQDTDLLLWPETALPFYPRFNRLFAERIQPFLAARGVSLLTGAPDMQLAENVTNRSSGENPKHYFNSSLLIDRKGQIRDSYNKQHLVPFGEYLPFRNILPLPGPLVETIGDFSPGTSTLPLANENARLGVLICYESIFPDLARKETANGANVLINLSNDAWYGRSSAPWQQLSMATLRAVENQRSLARSTNTGISTIIDPLGRIEIISPLFEKFFYTSQVALNHNRTFFTRYGHLFAPCCLLIGIIMVIISRRSKRIRDDSPLHLQI